MDVCGQTAPRTRARCGTEEFMVHICLLFLLACWPLALMTSIPLCGILCTTRNSFLCTQDTLQTSFLSRYVVRRNEQLNRSSNLSSKRINPCWETFSCKQFSPPKSLIFLITGKKGLNLILQSVYADPRLILSVNWKEMVVANWDV